MMRMGCGVVAQADSMEQQSGSCPVAEGRIFWLCAGIALFEKDAELSMRDIEATLLVCAQQCALDDDDEVSVEAAALVLDSAEAVLKCHGDSAWATPDCEVARALLGGWAAAQHSCSVSQRW